jgi:hypothetical protein
LVGQPSPKPRTVSFANDVKPIIHTPIDLPNPFEFQERVPNTSRPLDLDGMTVMTGLEVGTPAISDPNVGLDMDLEAVAESPGEEAEELPWGNDPATATWAPMMAEVNSKSHLICKVLM